MSITYDASTGKTIVQPTSSAPPATGTSAPPAGIAEPGGYRGITKEEMLQMETPGIAGDGTANEYMTGNETLAVMDMIDQQIALYNQSPDMADGGALVLLHQLRKSLATGNMSDKEVQEALVQIRASMGEEKWNKSNNQALREIAGMAWSKGDTAEKAYNSMATNKGGEIEGVEREMIADEVELWLQSQPEETKKVFEERGLLAQIRDGSSMPAEQVRALIEYMRSYMGEDEWNSDKNSPLKNAAFLAWEEGDNSEQLKSMKGAKSFISTEERAEIVKELEQVNLTDNTMLQDLIDGIENGTYDSDTIRKKLVGLRQALGEDNWNKQQAAPLRNAAALAWGDGDNSGELADQRRWQEKDATAIRNGIKKEDRDDIASELSHMHVPEENPNYSIIQKLIRGINAGNISDEKIIEGLNEIERNAGDAFNDSPNFIPVKQAKALAWGDAKMNDDYVPADEAYAIPPAERNAIADGLDEWLNGLDPKTRKQYEKSGILGVIQGIRDGTTSNAQIREFTFHWTKKMGEEKMGNPENAPLKHANDMAWNSGDQRGAGSEIGANERTAIAAELNAWLAGQPEETQASMAPIIAGIEDGSMTAEQIRELLHDMRVSEGEEKYHSDEFAGIRRAVMMAWTEGDQAEAEAIAQAEQELADAEAALDNAMNRGYSGPRKRGGKSAHGKKEEAVAAAQARVDTARANLESIQAGKAETGESSGTAGAVPGAAEAVPGAAEAVPGAAEAVPGAAEAVPGAVPVAAGTGGQTKVDYDPATGGVVWS